MTIDLWHFEYKLRHNNIDSQHKKDFNPAEIDAILNDAILIWVFQQYSGSNPKQTSAETTQQRWDNLSTLLVKESDQPALSPVANTGDVFEFSLNDLRYNYLHAARIRAVIEGCTNKIKVKTVQHDDIDTYLEDPFKKPSKGPFPRLIGNFGLDSTSEGNSSYYVYTDNTFDIESLYVEYFKRPKIISLGGYNDINGNLTIRQESDIPSDFHSQIIDIAVGETRRILGDTQRFQLSSQKQLINE
jgi:hypothetical protein